MKLHSTSWKARSCNTDTQGEGGLRPARPSSSEKEKFMQNLARTTCEEEHVRGRKRERERVKCTRANMKEGTEESYVVCVSVYNADITGVCTSQL